MTASQAFTYNGITTTNYFEAFPALQDNRFTLRTDLTASIRPNAGLTYSNAFWKIEDDNFMWKQIANSTYYSEPIISVTTSSFKTKGNYTAANGQILEVTSEFTKQ
ncbi:hypothetical protein GCM10023184_14730 [Flaviaesturariibacter amylovorans]|uniref:Uncharacterized protein n=1 Tax=Flaviaesturariibacter amylovorans TaxID=1084520 RepID=A0ABP8GKS4_9BACT